MKILPIRSDSDYHAALCELSQLFDSPPAPDTAQGERFAIVLASFASD